MRAHMAKKILKLFETRNTPLELIFLSVIFVCAAWFKFSIPNVPLSDPDTWGYLYPALSSLAGEGFQQTHGRGIAYPLFLLLILSVTNDFFSIPPIQHFVGLVSGLVWWAVWRQWTHTLPPRFRYAIGIQLVGIFFLALYMWNATAVYYESMIRPEAVFPFLALLQTLLTLLYIRKRWLGGNSKLIMVFSGSLAMALALICLSAKPSWGFAAAAPFATVALGLFGNFSLHQSIPRTATILIGLIFCSLWLYVVPANLDWRKDNRSKEFLPATLFTVHAPTISKYLNAQRDQRLLSKDEIKFLDKFDLRISEAKQQTIDTKRYRNLGHDPDYLMYHSDTLSWFPNGQAPEEKRNFMMDSYLGAALKYPLDIAIKITWQVKVAFSDLQSSLYKKDISLKTRLSGSLKAMDYYKLPEISEQLSKSYADVYMKISEINELENLKFSFGPQLSSFITKSLGPFAIGLVMLGWPVILLLRQFGKLNETIPPDFMSATLVFGVFWAACIGTTLTVATVHSFDITRYSHLLSAQQSLVLAPAVAAFLVLLMSLLKRRCDSSAASENEI
jgi:hypothetical protein